MDNHFNTPAEVIDLSIKACENKTRLPLGKMILLGIMAGAFIAFGGATSSTRSTRSRKCWRSKSSCRMYLPCRTDAHRISWRRTFYRKLSNHHGRV